MIVDNLYINITITACINADIAQQQFFLKGIQTIVNKYN